MKWKPIFARICDMLFLLSTFFAAFCGQVVVITRYIERYDTWPYKGIGHGVMQNYFWNFMAACLFYVLYRIIVDMADFSKHKVGLWIVRGIFFTLIAFSLPWLINSRWIQFTLNMVVLLMLIFIPQRERILFGVMLFTAFVNLWLASVNCIRTFPSVSVLWSSMKVIEGLIGPLLFIILLVFVYFQHHKASQISCLSVIGIVLLVNMCSVFHGRADATFYIWSTLYMFIPLITCIGGMLLWPSDKAKSTKLPKETK